MVEEKDCWWGQKAIHARIEQEKADKIKSRITQQKHKSINRELTPLELIAIANGLPLPTVEQKFNKHVYHKKHKKKNGKHR
jgi:hypothetical protein